MNIWDHLRRKVPVIFERKNTIGECANSLINVDLLHVTATEFHEDKDDAGDSRGDVSDDSYRTDGQS